MWRYEPDMNVKTSVMLPEELVQAIDHFAVQYASRSQFIEHAIRVFLAQSMHAEQNAHDVDILNNSADELNHEVMDALAYQVPV
jgi:metal-responsive CopG/Arc/MetJ family transcriptional regulator